MAGVAVAGVVVALLVMDVRTAGGFALGAGVALLGYSWLHKAVVTMMDAGKERPSKLMVGKIVIRYPLAIAAVFVFYRENWLPFQAVLAGLFVPVAGVVAESLYQVSLVFRHSNPS